MSLGPDARPRLRLVAEVNGWSLVSREADGRPRDWLLSPVGSTEGPVLVFPTADAATAHAASRAAVPAGRPVSRRV